MNLQNEFLNIKIDDLIPSQHQPRKVFNKSSLEELSESIKKYGILNPILVKKNGENYEIISGERRVKACILAGITEIPARILEVDDKKITEIATAENLQRENVSPIEEAKSFEKIMQDNNITTDKLNEFINKKQSIIDNKLTLLTLPENIQQALNERKIGERHARSLMNVESDEKKTELLNRIINEKLTVKELDNIINTKEIKEEEIENALQDITKALNINLEEKEEKESDNMNNGNFFPNVEQNTTPETNQLNPMNMQPMTPPQPTDAAPTPDPVVNPIPDFSVQPENNATIAQSTPAAPPLFGGIEVSNTPSPTDIPQPDTNINVNPIMPEQPVVPEVPVMEQPVVEEPIIEPTQPVVDPPLFGGMETPATPLEPAVDIPVVETPPVVEPTASPTFETVEALLNSNGISYKAYSNETGHCIIIEI